MISLNPSEGQHIPNFVELGCILNSQGIGTLLDFLQTTHCALHVLIHNRSLIDETREE